MSRIRCLVEAPAQPNGDFVLYWMTSARRTTSNFGLDRALEWARELGKPLLVLEALRVGYPWASDRFHTFVIQGMADQARAFAEANIRYLAYVERTPDEGKGLLAALTRHACLVIGDDFPTFFLPTMLKRAAQLITKRFEVVDSNGLLPMHFPQRTFVRAHFFRNYLTKVLAPHFEHQPNMSLGRWPGALAEVPSDLKWTFMSSDDLSDPRALIASLPIDHEVTAIEERGGSNAAQHRLKVFLKNALMRYKEDRSHPDEDAASRLSSWLHFGHIGVHQIVSEVYAFCDKPPLLTPKGETPSLFWNLPESPAGFLDELIIWRELGYNRAANSEDFMRYDGLPAWARTTLGKHASDPRPHLATYETLEAANTNDPLWNAAQLQLKTEGRIQNYMRMLWGKKVLEWSASPEEAWDTLIKLNDKYSIDGRNPNSYTSIGWIFGAYDRPWAPERPIFGMIRYMSSDSAKKKLKMRNWLLKYAEAGAKRVSPEQATLFNES